MALAEDRVAAITSLQTSAMNGDQVKQRWVSQAILLLALLLAFANIVQNPLFESPDELLHYRFVRYLLDEGQLPIQPADDTLTQYHQPPLYYLGGAVLVAGIEDPQTDPLVNPFWLSYNPGDVHRDNKAQFLPQQPLMGLFSGTALVVRLLRLWSLLLLAGILWALKRMAMELWPQQPGQQALFLAVAALNPMLLYVGSSVNNDNLVVLLGTLLLLVLIRGLRTRFTALTAAVVGLLWGAAALSKITGLLLLAPVAVAMLWSAYRERRWSRWLALGVAALGVGLLLSGWWFARNVSLYGELFGVERMLDIWGERTAGEWDVATLVATLQYAQETFWARFGYGQIVLPDVLYVPFVALTLLGVGGLLLRLREVTRAARERQSGAWLTLAVAAVVFLAAFAYFMWRNPSGANGRYIYPAIGALAAFVASGVARLPLQRVVRPATILIMSGIAIFSLAWLVPWTYAAPAHNRTVANSQTSLGLTELSWEPGMQLRGAALHSRDVSGVENPEAQLYACWLARRAPQENYVFYVHILDRDLEVIGRRDTHTGLGNYPTSLWQSDTAFCETYRVPLDASHLEGPHVADVTIGFYGAQSRDPLPALADGEAPLDFVVVDRLKVSAPASRVQADETPLATFEEGLALLSYEWASQTVAPGETATLRLRWAASGPATTSYTIFAHLLDEGGELLAQHDKAPLDGAYPTQFWGEGEVISDEHVFAVPADAGAGSTSVLLGFYDPADNARLQRTGGDGLPDAVQIPGPAISP